jgi:hypothetical protein
MYRHGGQSLEHGAKAARTSIRHREVAHTSIRHRGLRSAAPAHHASHWQEALGLPSGALQRGHGKALGSAEKEARLGGGETCNITHVGFADESHVVDLVRVPGVSSDRALTCARSCR